MASHRANSKKCINKTEAFASVFDLIVKCKIFIYVFAAVKIVYNNRVTTAVFECVFALV